MDVILQSPPANVRTRFDAPRREKIRQNNARCDTLAHGQRLCRKPALHMNDPSYEQFCANGYVAIRNLASASEIMSLRKAIERELMSGHVEPAEYEADLRYPGAPTSREGAGGATTRRLLQAYARDSLFREWAHAPSLLIHLRKFLGAQIALSQIHHNCIMTKHPRYSSRTGWHQDIRYWAFERGELISAWLALGPEVVENGCLSFLPGSHRMEMGTERFDESKFLRTDLRENEALIEARVTPTLQAGDVILFHCRTFHAAGENRTEIPKWSLVFTYHAADDRPLPGSRSASLPSIPV
jgi:phytanoyl-CoA hydroxylase